MFLEFYFLAWFIPYVVIALWVTLLVAKHQKTVKAKWIGGSITASIFYLILFGDSLLGHLYLQYLCTTQGGPHIYQTVELGPEYWNEDGSAKFIYPKGHKHYGSLNKEILKGEYFNYSYDSKKKYSFNIKKDGFGVKNKSNHVLGEQIIFRFGGGWLVNSIGYSVKGNSCTKQDKFFIKLLNKIFIKNK